MLADSMKPAEAILTEVLYTIPLYRPPPFFQCMLPHLLKEAMLSTLPCFLLALHHFLKVKPDFFSPLIQDRLCAIDSSLDRSLFVWDITNGKLIAQGKVG